MHVPRLQAIRRLQGYHLLPVKPGMMLEIHEKIGEGNNQRIRKFKGIVLKVKRPGHIDGSFTIRGKTSGHTIEKIYPLSFPNFEHVYLLDQYKIARAKLYYLRDKIGKDAKMKSKISAQERGIDLLVQAREVAAQETPIVATASIEESIDEKTEIAVDVTPESQDEQVTEESVQEDVREETNELQETSPAAEGADEKTQDTEEESPEASMKEEGSQEKAAVADESATEEPVQS